MNKQIDSMQHQGYTALCCCPVRLLSCTTLLLTEEIMQAFCLKGGVLDSQVPIEGWAVELWSRLGRVWEMLTACCWTFLERARCVFGACAGRDRDSFTPSKSSIFAAAATAAPGPPKPAYRQGAVAVAAAKIAKFSETEKVALRI